MADSTFAAIGGSERGRTGLPIGQLVPELAEQGFLTLLDGVYRSGLPYTGRDVRVQLGTGPAAREAFFGFTYEPRTDAGGHVIGVRIVGVETTQVKHAQRLTAEHRALLEQIALQASILARDGSLLGTFAMYHRVPRTPKDFDLALARVFADTAALAIERHHAEQARLAAEAKEAAARKDLAFLLEASTALSAGLDHTETLQRLADTCAPTLAPCARSTSWRPAGSAVSPPPHPPRPRKTSSPHTPLYDGDHAVARVLATGLSEVARRTPTGPGPWHSLDVSGYLCIPLLDRGRAFAAVTLLSTGEQSFDGHTIALAEELARRAASAALNARQYTQRAALARDLQAGLLLAQVPTLPGAEMATLYHPAGEGLDIGGDFYERLPPP